MFKKVLSSSKYNVVIVTGVNCFLNDFFLSAVQKAHVDIVRTETQNERQGQWQKERAEKEGSDRRRTKTDSEGTGQGQAPRGRPGQERVIHSRLQV